MDAERKWRERERNNFLIKFYAMQFSLKVESTSYLKRKLCSVKEVSSHQHESEQVYVANSVRVQYNFAV